MKIGPIYIKEEIKVRSIHKEINYRLPGRTGDYIGGTKSPRFFGKGNKYAEAARMTTGAHKSRMKGLFKAWAIKGRMLAGERIMPRRIRKKIKMAHNQRIRANIAREAREIQNMARMQAESAMKRLAQIIDDPNSQDTSAIAASVVVLERAYGKANQTNINANIDANGKPTEVTSAELNTRIEEALRRVEGATPGAAKPATRTRRPIDLRKLDRDPGSSQLH